MLYAKWTEPVVSIIAAYELLREGVTDQLPTVVSNLRMFFAGIPDTEAIALCAGLPHTAPQFTPLLLDGALAFAERNFLPLPESRLDYRGPWTLWRRRRLNRRITFDSRYQKYRGQSIDCEVSAPTFCITAFPASCVTFTVRRNSFGAMRCFRESL